MADTHPGAAAAQRGTRRSFLKRVLGAGAVASAASGGVRGVVSAQGRGGVRGFDHVAVPMRNTEAMVSFYRALGFEVMEGERICSVHGGRTDLLGALPRRGRAAVGDNKINFHRPSLWESGTFTLRAPAAQPPCGDFCFVWDGTAAALEAALARVGATVIEGPAPRQGGRDGGAATGTSRYIRDPDDNLLEFIIY